MEVHVGTTLPVHKQQQQNLIDTSKSLHQTLLYQPTYLRFYHSLPKKKEKKRSFINPLLPLGIPPTSSALLYYVPTHLPETKKNKSFSSKQPKKKTYLEEEEQANKKKKKKKFLGKRSSLGGGIVSLSLFLLSALSRESLCKNRGTIEHLARSLLGVLGGKEKK